MRLKNNYLDGLRKLGETLSRLLKKNSLKPQPVVVALPRKFQRAKHNLN